MSDYSSRLEAYQTDIENGLQLLQTIRETTAVQKERDIPAETDATDITDNADRADVPVKHKVNYKELNVLLIAPPAGSGNESNEVMLEDSLRHLVQDVFLVKYDHRLLDVLERKFDLILILGGEELLPEENVSVLKATPITKAVWLSDEEGLTEVERQFTPLADYVFTHRPANIPIYQDLSCKKCRCLTFAADTDVFYPRPVDSGYESDVLIIGDAVPGGILSAFAGSDVLLERKVRVCGEGWDEFEACAPVPAAASQEERALWFNGAKVVVNGSGSYKRMREVAACGTFQLVQERTDASLTTQYGEQAAITFASVGELADKFAHYGTHVDHRRLAASRALADNKYNHSYLQKGLQLLGAVFD